jgi:hypothetical protein
MVATIGGEPRRFRRLIDLYRETGRQAGPTRTFEHALSARYRWTALSAPLASPTRI